MKTKANIQEYRKRAVLYEKKTTHFFWRWFSIANAEIIKIANSEMSNLEEKTLQLHFSISFSSVPFSSPFSFYSFFQHALLAKAHIYLHNLRGAEEQYKEAGNAYLDDWQNKGSKKSVRQNFKYWERKTLLFLLCPLKSYLGKVRFTILTIALSKLIQAIS